MRNLLFTVLLMLAFVYSMPASADPIMAGVSTGHTLQTSRSDDGRFTIDASGWRSGVYAVRVVSSDGIRTAKIHVK